MKSVFCVLLLVLLPALVQAEVYRYTDSQGTPHYVSSPSKVPEKYRNQEISVLDAVPAAGETRSEAPAPSAQYGSVKVEVYMTSWCGYCKRMIALLKSKGIPYTAYDIEKDPAAARMHEKLGGGGVPLIHVGNHVVRGYDPEAVLHYAKGN